MAKPVAKNDPDRNDFALDVRRENIYFMFNLNRLFL